ncbi:PQQ-dependent sugar dehydrogenase [Lewinella sp. JB7]|uniref:PQQ-dependent sugar dehydrogenase n=1 Tax=Lewinella sp. JB7 TaxID=2962887 RepID=UPI0020C9CA2C|nr:PQQ-dependent sugar dehydrogenase [Lewinella sp. JB7]MCP9237788.1 PQQ-dependent sugar dehydrogenase [Lewinella sp. JB7]
MHGIIVLCVMLMLWSSCGNEEPGANRDEKPEQNRFTTTILTDPGSLEEPMAFTFLNEEEVMLVERPGGVKVFHVSDRDMRRVGHVDVNTIYTNREGKTRVAEEGLMGVIADPEFAENNWVYMLYADPDSAKHVLARFVYRDDSLHTASRTIVLEYPAQREVCCHTGGGMVFDADGNLYLTTGNNTANPPSGTSNLDERPGEETADDQRTAGNTNDLRGKILRIHPEDDGGYTIPAGNLFAEGTPRTRPEIYTMGHRNPWRVSLDSETGYMYWGEVGPDASVESPRGPRGYDEFNRAKGPGFFGWPYFIGDNIPYADFDYATDSVGPLFDPAHPVNESVNNTGLTELPQPQEAFIWYPYSFSEQFPLLGSAGRSATGGPVYRQADFAESTNRFPAYYEGKWLAVEFMRGWIMAIDIDENGDYAGMEPFLPGENFSSAIDMQFGPDGNLYVLEYGSAWFRGNDNAQLKQIQYNGGNRAPVVQATAEPLAGALPLNVRFSSAGTEDYDGDDLQFVWEITGANDFSQTLRGESPELTLSEAGTYAVELTVTDAAGNTNSTVFELLAGNAPPAVDIVITGGNQSFYFPGSTLDYEISVADQEDGSLKNGEIKQEAVAVNFDYAPEGYDPIEIAQNHRSSDEWVLYAKGKELINESDCLSCHRVDVKSVGPSYVQVAERYRGTPEEKAMLVTNILNGSVGKWGDHGMSAHPDLPAQQAKLMVDYILSLDDVAGAKQSVPLRGTYVTETPDGENGRGGYLLRAAYTDRGTGSLRPLTSEKIIALRNPVLDVEKHDVQRGTQLTTTPGRSFNVVEHEGYIGYRNLDLTGIERIVIHAEASERSGAAGGVIEVRLDAPDGPLVGTTETVTSVEIDFGAEVGKLRAEWEAGGKKGPEPGYREVREKFRREYTVLLGDTAGRHDVYFVVKNPAAKTGQTLVQLQDIIFQPETQATK